SCSKSTTQPVYEDVPFLQDFSIKYYSDTTSQVLSGIASDRNGVIQVLSKNRLLRPYGGKFLYPGSLAPDNTYRFISDEKINAIGTYENQLVYLSDSVVFSNAWAARLYSHHTLPAATLFEGGKDFAFLISDGKTIQLNKDSKTLWSG